MEYTVQQTPNSVVMRTVPPLQTPRGWLGCGLAAAFSIFCGYFAIGVEMPILGHWLGIFLTVVFGFFLLYRLVSSDRIVFDVDVGQVVHHRMVAGMEYIVGSRTFADNTVDIRICTTDRTYYLVLFAPTPTQQPLKVAALATEQHTMDLLARLEQALGEQGLKTTGEVWGPWDTDRKHN